MQGFYFFVFLFGLLLLFSSPEAAAGGIHGRASPSGCCCKARVMASLVRVV